MLRAGRSLTIALSTAVLVSACQANAPGPSLVQAQGPSESGATATSTAVPPAVTPSPGATSNSASPEPLSTYVAQPQPSLALSGSGSPALPTKVRFEKLSTPCDLGPSESCGWFRVAWLEASPGDVSIRVYAVTTCLHTPTASTPVVKCLVSGDSIPPASLVLLGTAPAAAGTLPFKLGEGETAALGWLPGHGPAVDAVVVQAVNAHGGSLFFFAAVSGNCYGCVL